MSPNPTPNSGRDPGSSTGPDHRRAAADPPSPTLPGPQIQPHAPVHPRAQVIGPWPFVTLRRYHLGERLIVWRAREHRKGLLRAARALEAAPVPFWQTRAYNWSISALFAAGSLLFLLGSLIAMLPGGGVPPGALNLIFFLGSVPFTLAAYLQHFQAANARSFPADPAAHDVWETLTHRRLSFVGWHPRSAGWLSTYTQLVGTVAFNISTFDGMATPASWYQQDIALWMPDMIGSVLFLVSAWLALIEVGHGFRSWRPRDLAWQIAAVNLVGSIAFMAAALIAYAPPAPMPAWLTCASNASLGAGALCFLIGALLAMKESRLAEDPRVER